jgi:hypothetical protein
MKGCENVSFVREASPRCQQSHAGLVLQSSLLSSPSLLCPRSAALPLSRPSGSSACLPARLMSLVSDPGLVDAERALETLTSAPLKELASQLATEVSTEHRQKRPSSEARERDRRSSRPQSGRSMKLLTLMTPFWSLSVCRPV